MFRKLFGETETMQLRYLQPRVIITAIDLVLILIGIIAKSGGILELAGGIFAILALVWAWSFMKAWFGWTTFGAIFTGNIVFGVIIFLLYIIVGYLLGMVSFIIGTGRYIYLLVKRSQTGLN